MSREISHNPIDPIPTHRGNRRDFLKTLTGASGALCALSLPSVRAVGAEVVGAGAYQLRDLNGVYQAWSEYNQAAYLPSYNVFEEAVTVCRKAACTIFLMKAGEMVAMHSGFVVSIPAEHETPQSKGRTYVVTCDHARLQFAGSSPIIQLSDGTNVRPKEELVTKRGVKGLPTKDLRVYECVASGVSEETKLSLRGIDVRPPQDAPVMTYEPLNLRTAQAVVDGQPRLEPSVAGSTREQFVLTHIIKPGGFPYDSSYPQSSGFVTAGQLRVGGSGSPVVLFDREEGFTVAGHQVSYGVYVDEERRTWFDGEINQDGHVVHINNTVKLLRDEGRWK